MVHKHAYLILAHSQFNQLAFLVSLLDHQDNDIFIHIDKKSNIDDYFLDLIKSSAKQSQVYFTERVSVSWGGYSQIEAEMILFKAASKRDSYYFYHLISGVDLPLLSQQRIHDFFDDYKDYSFLTFMNIENNGEDINRFKYYHLFESFTYRTLPGAVGKLAFKIYRNLEVWIQKLFRVNRYKLFNVSPIKASQWVSLPNNIVEILIDKESDTEKMFRKSFLSDEIFIPMILNKELRNFKVYDASINHGYKKEFQGNLRYINWWDGKPYTWTDSEKDLKELRLAAKNGYLFSRKFDIENYPKIKELIVELTKEI